jgi:putative hydrolase of the HAD superfamily
LKAYKHIFFDLDHTLWDYETNSKQTLFELYDRFDLASKGATDAEDFFEHFNKINFGLWDKYNVGAISQYYLRNSRFPLVFDAMGINPKLCPEPIVKEFNECYLKECSQKSGLIEGTKEVLDYLRDKYVLHIITNGFEEVQSIKLASSGIGHYFEELITSERAGAKKPYPAIYKFALKATGALLEESIMIGDNLKTDIQGAIDYNMDQVYYNPAKTAHDSTITHEIIKLNQLLALL